MAERRVVAPKAQVRSLPPVPAGKSRKACAGFAKPGAGSSFFFKLVPNNLDAHDGWRCCLGVLPVLQGAVTSRFEPHGRKASRRARYLPGAKTRWVLQVRDTSPGMREVVGSNPTRPPNGPVAHGSRIAPCPASLWSLRSRSLGRAGGQAVAECARQGAVDAEGCGYFGCSWFEANIRCKPG